MGRKVIDAMLDDDDYISALASELMLDEVLGGECDPLLFLKRAIKKVYSDQNKELSMLKNKIWEDWVDSE